MSFEAIWEAIQNHGFAISLVLILLLLGWLFNLNEDLRPHRLAVAISLALLGVVPLIWLVFARANNRFAGSALSFLCGMIALRQLFRIMDRATNDFLGGLVFDLVFAEGPFATVYRAPRKLPNLKLLKHWRATGAARKAYRIARRSLVERPDAYPLWLFAAETAALHLRKMPTAIRLVRRLCRSAEFSDDQKSFALNHLRGWAAEQGSDLSVQRIRNSYGPSPKPAPLKTIHRLRSQGRCQEAKGELLRLLRRDPENLAVAVLLVRVYAQDLHRRDKALQQINGLEKKPFTPAGVIDFLRNSLDEWSRVPSNRPSPNSLLPVGSPRFVGSAESSVSARAWPRVMKLLRRCPGGAARQDSGRGEARPAFTENLTPAIAKLVNEGLLGTAVDSLRTLIQQSPEDLTLRLQLAQVWMVNCGTLSAAESTINEIDGDSRFTDAQKAMAKGQLTRWRRQLAEHYPA